MAQGDTPITVSGNLVADPELRYTNTGTPVANFRIASTPRAYNRNTNQWEDGDPLFLSCTAWKQLGENAANTLVKGMPVVVTGKLKQRNYTTREGEQRTQFEVEVEDLGPSLKFATAQVQRNERGGGYQGGGQQGYQGQQQPQGGFGGDRGGFGQGQQQGGAPQGGQQQGGGQDYDPWGSAPGGAPQNDEPPF